tara:strand:- start:696 stop:2225 length:1530 start_codon:yes stop_codon:yes gene_type:complete
MKISPRLQISLVTGILITFGLALTLYKNIELGFPLSPGQQQTVWKVESKISFEPIDGPVNISMALPQAQAGWQLFNEHFASSGFSFIVQDKQGVRQAEWARRSLNQKTTLHYKFEIYQSNTIDLENIPAPNIITPELTPDRLTAMKSVVSSLKQHSNSPVSFTQNLLEKLLLDDIGQNASFLLANKENSKLSVIMDILAFANVPHHTVKGIFLEDGRRRQTIDTLIEIHDGKHWHIFNPSSGEKGLPENFFIWQRGAGSILNVMGGKDSRLEFALVKNTLPLKTILFLEQHVQEQLLLDFSIYSLPVEQQGVFKGLLLIPVGALVVVLLRVLVGIRTAGTFMPILIALAFVQTTLLTGLFIFLLVVGIGLWIRYYLSYLNLLLVARITAVVIVVILLMATLSIVSYKLDLDQLLTVTFLPIIILAWTIERMSILWEEEGGHEVLIQGSGSLFAATLSYLLMSAELVKHLTFNFPELMISLLGFVLLLGRYTGYRLVELHRFRYLGRPDE